VGKYFGREPRYSKEEAEAQAKAAIEAAVSRGRPPESEWAGLSSRMSDIDRALAARPPAVEMPHRPRESRPPPGGPG
jgi:hypothetical protein